jgi:hypothetical protein
MPWLQLIFEAWEDHKSTQARTATDEELELDAIDDEHKKKKKKKKKRKHKK